jgi:hypothetical protein
MRAPCWGASLSMLGLVVLSAMLVAGALPDGTYELEPGELSWWDVCENGGPAVQALPVEPGEPFTIVADRTWSPCVDEDSGEPYAEEARWVGWDHWLLTVDGITIDREGFLVPCPEQPVQETQAITRWSFPEGLDEGTYDVELIDTAGGGVPTEEFVESCTLAVGGSEAPDAGTDGVEPVDVLPPDLIDTGAGGAADPGPPVLVALLVLGVTVGALALIRDTR